MSPSSSAGPCQSRSVEMFPNKTADRLVIWCLYSLLIILLSQRFPKKSAEMCQSRAADPCPSRHAALCHARAARPCPSRSAAWCPGSSASMCRASSARVCQRYQKYIQADQKIHHFCRRSAALCPGSSALPCPRKCAAWCRASSATLSPLRSVLR